MSLRYHSLKVLVVIAAFLSASGALQASPTDDRIEESARATYVYRTYLDDDDITIVAKDGIVTLTGTVAAESHRTLAQDTVEGLPGVTRVNNLLTVPGEQPQENSDTWIATKVKTSLWFHRSVARKTNVDVKDGVVTLSGSATSEAQKELTTEYARDVQGVKSVLNRMTVIAEPQEPGRSTKEKIDDASITAQVKLSLSSHLSTSAARTKAVTRDGVVTLTGEALNQAEKDLVSKFTRDVDGVKRVQNDMTIKV